MKIIFVEYRKSWSHDWSETGGLSDLIKLAEAQGFYKVGLYKPTTGEKPRLYFENKYWREDDESGLTRKCWIEGD